MKACFFLHRKITPIGNMILYHLSQMGVSEFCAYVAQRNAYDFLRTQKRVHYSGLLLDEDIHKKAQNATLDWNFLNAFEKEYGIPNIWPYLLVDRILLKSQLIREYPYEKPLLSLPDLLKQLQTTAQEIISFLEKEKPDLLIFVAVGSLVSMLLYHIAKKKGIRIVQIDATRIGNGLTLTDDYRTLTHARDAFRELEKRIRISPQKDSAEAFLKSFREAPRPYATDYTPSNRPLSRRTQLKFFTPRRFIKSATWLFKLIIDYAKKRTYDYTDETPWYAVWDRTKRKLRSFRGFSDFYSKLNPNETYAFFGLHLEPEVATLLAAPRYTDQINLVRQIASALPINFKLYVKDHPFMVGYRPRSYYKELLKIPNVVLLDPAYQSFDVIRPARLVFTITSTAGWEAVLFKKPVITFGDVFYNELKTVTRVRSFEDLADIVAEKLRTFEPNEKELLNFIAALLETSTDVPLIELWEHEDQGSNIEADPGLRNLAALIKKYYLSPHGSATSSQKS